MGRRVPWWIWIAGGAALLLVVRAMSKKTRLVLTSWKENQLPPGWAKDAKRAGFHAVSKKVAQGGELWRPGEAESVFRQADAAGLKRHGWGWHFIRSPAEAIAEGQGAAQIAKDYGLRAYWVNAEKPWAGVEGEPETENPPRELSTFVDAFRGTAPGVELIFNGFSWSKTSDGRPLLTPEVLAKFDAFGPMNYGTSRKTIANKYKARSARARELGIGFAPMHGTGRMDAGGQVWGFVESGPDAPGLVDLVKADPPRYLAFWYGAGSREMLTGGSAANPPLSILARRIS